jgi:hypothetical protein
MVALNVVRIYPINVKDAGLAIQQEFLLEGMKPREMQELALCDRD